MFSSNTMYVHIAFTIAVWIILVFMPIIAQAQSYLPADQNKYRSDLILFFTDTDTNGWHDPGESFFDEPGPTTSSNDDNSCWMASASNLLVYAGCPNLYGQPYPGFPGWLGNGGAPSPNVGPWSEGYTAGGGGNFMTFDDGGYPHWAIAYANKEYDGPIITEPKFLGGVWDTNPITWCQIRLHRRQAVGFAVWWGTPPRDAMPGRVDFTQGWFYHAITLYDINVNSTTVTFTDSDDNFSGTRTCTYWYEEGDNWIIKDLYPGYDVVVNYAVALKGYNTCSAPSLTQWSLIVLVILVAGSGIWLMLKRRRAVRV